MSSVGVRHVHLQLLAHGDHEELHEPDSGALWVDPRCVALPTVVLGASANATFLLRPVRRVLSTRPTSATSWGSTERLRLTSAG